jgi:hypothetical protein
MAPGQQGLERQKGGLEQGADDTFQRAGGEMTGMTGLTGDILKAFGIDRGERLRG